MSSTATAVERGEATEAAAVGRSALPPEPSGAEQPLAAETATIRQTDADAASDDRDTPRRPDRTSPRYRPRHLPGDVGHQRLTPGTLPYESLPDRPVGRLNNFPPS